MLDGPEDLIVMTTISETSIKRAIADSFLAIGKRPKLIGADSNQAKVVKLIVDSFVSNRYKHVILRSPVGSGKSVIGAISILTMHKLLNDLDEIDTDDDYISHLLTPTKLLAEQYEETFAGVKDFVVALGADNFKCKIGDDNDTAADCIVSNKDLITHKVDTGCIGCQFLKQKYDLLQKSALVSATAYGFFYTMYSATRPVLMSVYDEAHTLPSVFSSMFEVSLTKQSFDKLIDSVKILPMPGSIINTCNDLKMTIFTEQFEVDQIIVDRIINLYSTIAEQAEASCQRISAIIGPISCRTDPEYKRLKRLWRSSSSTASSLSMGIEYAKGFEYINDEKVLKVSPINPGQVGWKAVNTSKYNLYMSGTLDPESLAIQLGINQDEVAVIDIEYAWDRRRKPVITFKDDMYMNKRAIDNEKASDVFYKKIATITKAHMIDNGESGLIIPTSFAMAKSIKTYLTAAGIKNLIIHDGSKELRALIKEYISKVQVSPTVFIAPAMFEGFDGANELARFCIIPKSPFGSIGGVRPKALATLYPTVYKTETANKLVQALGRGVRNESDWCIYYILDKLAMNVLDHVDSTYKIQYNVVSLNDVDQIQFFKSKFDSYIEKTK